MGNESSLASLIGNLLDNAIRYTPEGGKVELRLSSCVNGEASLTVADSGEGIPQRLHEKVKQRFYRLPSAKVGGSGLGLSIVKDAIEQGGWQWQMDQSDMGGVLHCIQFNCTIKRGSTP